MPCKQGKVFYGKVTNYLFVVNTAICPICRQITQKIVYKKITPKGDLAKCIFCGIYFVWPKVILGSEVYNECYYNAWAIKNIGSKDFSSMKKATFYRLFDEAKINLQYSSILDIGCAMGHLLEVAREKGFDTYGIDISQYSADIAMQKIGYDKILVGDIMEMELPDKKFDVITAVDVIEHIYDTGLFLNICKRLLKENGYLVFIAPVMDSFSRKLFGKFWHHFNEHHVLFFSRKSMINLLKKHGFRVVRIGGSKKALNFIYVKSMVEFYKKRALLLIIEIIGFFLPSFLKRKNLFLSSGNMLVVAQKDK